MKRLMLLGMLLCACGGSSFEGSGLVGAVDPIADGGVAAGGSAGDFDGGTRSAGGTPGAEAGGALATGGRLSSAGGAPGTGGVSSAGGVPGSGGATVAAGGADGGAPACLTDLSGVGTGDFRVEFAITTTTVADVALLAQELGCSQPSIVWSVSLNYNGRIAAGTGDGLAGHWVTTTGANSVADGKPHVIVFARTSGKIWISRDGAVDSIPVDDPYSLGAFPPLQIGTTDCPGFGSAQKSAVTISDVCVSEP